MKKKFLKLLSLGLACTLGCMPVFAGAASQEVEDDTTMNMDVSVSVASVWNISIPDKITVDGSTKSGTYEIAVYGNVIPIDIMEIIPVTGISFDSEWDETVHSGKVTQAKTVFTGSEIGDSLATAVKTSGTVTMTESTAPAGRWTTDVEFQIVMGERPGFYDDAGNLVVGWNASGINVAANCSYNAYQSKFTNPAVVPGQILKSSYPTVTKVVIPNGVTQIGEYAFYQCTQLKEVVIPPSVTVINKQAFYECSNLEKVKIYDGLTTIKSYGFGQNHISELYIPGTVTTFESCSLWCGINHITYKGTGNISNGISSSQTTVN